MKEILWILPWALFALAAVPLAFWRRPRLRRFPPPAAAESPLVSVIVPARNEAHDLGGCVATLLETQYPRYEIIIVDDRSTDGTGELAQALAAGGAGEVVAVKGEPLPPGWYGKAWACHQGYRRARGDLLLFTDADTRHSPPLLGHAVGALSAAGVQIVTVLPRLVLRGFWERVIQPQIWLLLALRYAVPGWLKRRLGLSEMEANGQFILISRAAYEAAGGHEAVRGDVHEDVWLARRVMQRGGGLLLAHAQELLAARMYGTLARLIEGWTRNLASGLRLIATPWLTRVMPWLVAAFLICFWVVPPAVLVAAGFVSVDAAVWYWAVGACVCSLVLWLAMNAVLRVPLAHTLLYPLGALLAALVFVRGAWRGRKVDWKGRRYDAGQAASD